MTATPDRRTVLKGAGAVAAAAGTGCLAACGGGGSAAAPQKTAAAGPPVTIPTSQVPEGGGVVLQQQPYVVTQPQAGTYKAFTKICPHQGCAVSFVKNQQIVCACHGSEFSIVDGARTAGPARTGLREYPVKVTGADLTVGG